MSRDVLDSFYTSDIFHRVFDVFWFVCFVVFFLATFWLYWNWSRKKLFKDSKFNWRWIIPVVLGLVAIVWVLVGMFLLLSLIFCGGV
jgi:hypothetical protein